MYEIYSCTLGNAAYAVHLYLLRVAATPALHHVHILTLPLSVLIGVHRTRTRKPYFRGPTKYSNSL
jgi:hypothetical protein